MWGPAFPMSVFRCYGPGQPMGKIAVLQQQLQSSRAITVIGTPAASPVEPGMTGNKKIPRKLVGCKFLVDHQGFEPRTP